jgi:hypothetical protein
MFHQTEGKYAREGWIMKMLAMCALVLGAVVLAGCPRVAPLRLTFDYGNYGDSGSLSLLHGAHSAPGQQMACRFSLNPGLSTVSLIRWWGVPEADSTDPENLIIRIFEDNGAGAPAEAPLYSIPVGAATREDTGDMTVPGGEAIYAYTADLTPFSLTPTTTYYLSIVNDNGWTWLWMHIDSDPGAGHLFYRSGNSGPWGSTGSMATAFQIWQ